jgi:hypothetical protein
VCCFFALFLCVRKKKKASKQKHNTRSFLCEVKLCKSNFFNCFGSHFLFPQEVRRFELLQKESLLRVPLFPLSSLFRSLRTGKERKKRREGAQQQKQRFFARY